MTNRLKNKNPNYQLKSIKGLDHLYHAILDNSQRMFCLIMTRQPKANLECLILKELVLVIKIL